MNAHQRLLFVIEHLNSPFKKEIQRDLETALNEARADELEKAGIFGAAIYHYNDDGSTISSKEVRIKKLRGEIE
jgi:hypothetical protein